MTMLLPWPGATMLPPCGWVLAAPAMSPGTGTAATATGIVARRGDCPRTSPAAAETATIELRVPGGPLPEDSKGIAAEPGGPEPTACETWRTGDWPRVMLRTGECPRRVAGPWTTCGGPACRTGEEPRVDNLAATAVGNTRLVPGFGDCAAGPVVAATETKRCGSLWTGNVSLECNTGEANGRSGDDVRCKTAAAVSHGLANCPCTA
mmetsp:Transcript_54276/g.116590  ORF Transcript_54276/g.116590 Transcript_54276/m.116590 type:complete len:207 (+) Transcript_54276:713-1333(+)